MEMIALAPIEVEILLLFPLKSKRLERIAGLAPKKIWFYQNRNDKLSENPLHNKPDRFQKTCRV